MDRLLASPVRRGAMINGTLAYQGVTSVVADADRARRAHAAGARFAASAVGIV